MYRASEGYYLNLLVFQRTLAHAIALNAALQ